MNYGKTSWEKTTERTVETSRERYEHSWFQSSDAPTGNGENVGAAIVGGGVIVALIAVTVALPGAAPAIAATGAAIGGALKLLGIATLWIVAGGAGLVTLGTGVKMVHRARLLPMARRAFGHMHPMARFFVVNGGGLGVLVGTAWMPALLPLVPIAIGATVIYDVAMLAQQARPHRRTLPSGDRWHAPVIEQPRRLPAPRKRGG